MNVFILALLMLLVFKLPQKPCSDLMKRLELCFISIWPF